MFYESGRPFCMPPEIQLIQVYGDLCNPSKAPDWTRLLATEKRLREMTLAGVRPKIVRPIRARVPDPEKRGMGARDEHPVENVRISNFKQAIENKYSKNKNRVQIGYHPPQFAVKDFETERKYISQPPRRFELLRLLPTSRVRFPWSLGSDACPY